MIFCIIVIIWVTIDDIYYVIFCIIVIIWVTIDDIYYVIFCIIVIIWVTIDDIYYVIFCIIVIIWVTIDDIYYVIYCIIVWVTIDDIYYVIPYMSVYKSRNLSQNKILHRQFVLYTGNTLREEIIPKASWIFERTMTQQWWAIMHELMNIQSPH